MASNPEQPRPLKVLIVGAGIGGLTAALGLRQSGHEVTLFERSQLAKETGAAIHLAPNCHSVLRKLGVFPETFGANPVCGIAEYGADGKVHFDIDLRKPLSIWQQPWVLSHRVQLHEDLKRQATSPEGKGPPAVLKTGSIVASVDPDTATVTLEDGSSFSGDLVLGADGVSSVTRKIVTQKDIKPFGSGKSAFRFMIPHSQIRENPVTEPLTQRDGIMTMWMADDRRLVMYPCSHNTMMNFVGIHPSELSASKGEGWSRGATKQVLLDVFGEFEPRVKALLEMVDIDALRVWTLLDMDRIPTWYRGRLALLGDAAHPFLPHQGQGGGIAIEDAATIAVLFPRGITSEEVPERLALYEKIRDTRAHKVQELTRMAGVDLTDASRKNFNIMEFMHYNFGHDEFHHSTQQLRQHLWARNGPVRLRAPLSFGPNPSPRQDHFGAAIPSHDSRFTTYSVRFKSSTTYLCTLFPTPAFSFSGPGTVAQASFKCTELKQMRWLGGGGYRFIEFQVHGVQYAKQDGSKVHGTFIVVVMETLADPIITGREELGMPKVGCDIDVDDKGDGEGEAKIECSWRGASFLRIHLDGLKEEAVKPDEEAEAAPPQAAGPPPPGPPGMGPPPKEEGRIIYRYVPAVGNPGQADAEYAVLFRDGKDASSAPRVVEKLRRSENASFEFPETSAENLPTLHHIAAGFAGIPVYGVVEAKVEEGFGVDDLSNAERIE